MKTATKIEPTESERAYLLAAHGGAHIETVRKYLRDRESVRVAIRERLDRAARQLETA